MRGGAREGGDKTFMVLGSYGLARIDRQETQMAERAGQRRELNGPIGRPEGVFAQPA